MRKKLNADQKRALKAGELTTFVQQYARKAYPTIDPNDRRYDRKVEEKVKRMNPEYLSALINDDK